MTTRFDALGGRRDPDIPPVTGHNSLREASAGASDRRGSRGVGPRADGYRGSAPTSLVSTNGYEEQ